MDEKTEEKVRELQIIEQNLNNMIFQKQAFQLELSEINSAVEELNKSDGEVYKIIGNVMVKSEKDKLKKEIDEKKDIINLRVKNIEKQEKALKVRVEELRKDVLKTMK
ncbi:MAG: prefoldin subunit beta [Nanoarchaeota archaeon]|nr:prefoldin subunit beta [Nanoarchaeota archaeon]